MKIFLIILALILVLFAFDSIRMYFLFQDTLKLEKDFVSFQKINPQADKKILILGDSTAVGTGSANNAYSTAGRLSSLYPDAEVANISKNGLKLAGLNEKIKNLTGSYDIIVIQIGANDIMRLTSLKDIDSELDKLLTKAKSLSEQVIILHSGDIGESDFFPFYLKPILSSRSYNVREIYIKKTNLYGASYVDLIDLHMDKTYYSSDKLHLNDAGYGVWFDEIIKKIK